MALKPWKIVKNHALVFAGVKHSATLTVAVDFNQHAVCDRCRAPQGYRVCIEIIKILGKNGRPCGHHTFQPLAKEVREAFCHRGHVCQGCLAQPPFPI